MNLRGILGLALWGVSWLARADDDVFLIVNKQANELTAYSLQDPARVVKKFRAITGSSAGDKVSEGDRRTPEGIYFLENEIPKSRLIRLHGSAAFELNYPNPYDRIFKHTGHGIWIHGVDNESRMEKRFDTQGCVALSNLEVVELRKWIGQERMTPVLIVDKAIEGQPLGVETAETPLGQRVTEWAKVWASKDVESYLAFYDSNFYARKMKLPAWSRYKRRLARSYEKIEVALENLRIFRHGKYAVALFKQHYKSDRYESIGWKRLYLLGEGHEARILSEEMRKETDTITGTLRLQEKPGL